MPMIINNYKVGDILVFKKSHPCGGNMWKVLKYGVDCKLECTTCHRNIILSRVEISKKIKNICDSKKIDE